MGKIETVSPPLPSRKVKKGTTQPNKRHFEKFYLPKIPHIIIPYLN